MREMNPQVIQQPQQKGGLLGSLFSLMSMIPDPIVGTIGKLGSFISNPSIQGGASVGSQIAGFVGDSNGDGNTDAENQQGAAGSAEVGKDLVVQSAQDSQPVPTDSVTDAPAEEKNQAEDDQKQGYGDMKLGDLFALHPGLEQELPTILASLNKGIG